MSGKLSRRRFLQVGLKSLGALGLAACAPKTVIVEKEKVVTQVVKEVVKETVVVEGTPQVVEKEVTKLVEKIITTTPPPVKVTWVKFQTTWFTGSQPGQPAFWPAVIEAFEEKTPDLKIDLVEVGPTPEDVMTAIAGNTAPDAYHWYGSGLTVQQMAPKGILLPLDDFIDASDLNMDDYLPVQWEVKKWDGKIWGLPCTEGGVTSALSWHKRYFEEAGLDPERAPQDWQEMIEYAVKLTTYDDGGNITRQGYDPLDASSGSVAEWARYIDSQFISEDKKTMLFDQGNWPMALDIMAEIWQTVGVEKMEAFNLQWNYWIGSEKTGFNNGMRAMVINGSWQPGVLKRTMKDQSWELGYSWVPSTSGKNYCSFGSSHSLVIPRTCKIPEDAFRWIRFAMGLESNIIEWNVRGGFLWSKPLMDNIDFSGFPGLDFYFSMLEEADRVWSPLETQTPIGGELNKLWQRAREEAIYDQKTSKQALQDINTELQRALDRHWESEGG